MVIVLDAEIFPGTSRDLTFPVVRVNKERAAFPLMWKSFQLASLRSGDFALLLAGFLAFFAALFVAPFSAATPKELTTPGLVRDFSAPVEEVRQAVLAVVRDQIIHGTLIFDKSPILTGAEAVNSTPLFDPWNGPGEAYYKIRKDAIAPRHFLDSGDQGTIAVRFVIIPIDAERTRVKADAIYVENSHRTVHASDGNVEKMEINEIKERLEAAQEAAAEAADIRRRALSAELVRQSNARQQVDETSRLSSAQANEKDLQAKVNALHHELERQVKPPGADLKAAPFRSAATVRQIPAKASVLVLIVTPHWLGIETPDGQHGWLPIEQLEQIP